MEGAVRFFYLLESLTIHDRGLVVSIIARYGWHGFKALKILISEEQKRIRWQDYTGTVLWMIGKILGKDSWKIDSYVEMAYPGVKDERTAEEILQDLERKLV